MSPHESELRQYFLDQAASLGELSSTALAYMMADAEIADKWELALKKRLPWVDGHKWTLEDSAGLIGVTRERMRQIQNQLESVTLVTTVPPRVFYKVLALRGQVSTIDEFWQRLRSSGLAGPEEDWSKESLTELFLKLGNHSVVEDLGRIFRELSPPPPSRRVNSIIRDHRTNLFGNIDLKKAAESVNLSVPDVVMILKNLYTHVFHNDSVALAIQRPPAAFVDTVGKQLLVKPDVSFEALHEGLRRQMAYRGVSQDISLSDFEDLTKMVFGESPALGNLAEDFKESIQLSPHEQAFVDAFAESDRTNLHRNELIDAAKSCGLNPTSAGVYLSTSPIIRPSSVKRGYFRLLT
jgi:hypothetical protein